MKNHYHLLVETPEGNISRRMRYYKWSSYQSIVGLSKRPEYLYTDFVLSQKK